jgi:hypothetical protein
VGAGGAGRLPAQVAARLRCGCFLDPEHRLLSEVVWEAIEHAGIPAQRLPGTPTGMLFGIYQKDYMLRVQRPLEEVNAYAMYTGFDSIGPGRVGFMPNLRGPQVVVKSACAAGLLAVHSACQSLRTGESDVALAGAAMLTLGPEGVIAPGGQYGFDGTSVQHAQACPHVTPEGDPVPESCDPQQLLAEFPHAVDASDVYRQMREERGVHHGPPFVGLQSLHTHGRRRTTRAPAFSPVFGYPTAAGPGRRHSTAIPSRWTPASKPSPAPYCAPAPCPPEGSCPGTSRRCGCTVRYRSAATA